MNIGITRSKKARQTPNKQTNQQTSKTQGGKHKGESAYANSSFLNVASSQATSQNEFK
jgi:hypothetical protein